MKSFASFKSPRPRPNSSSPFPRRFLRGLAIGGALGLPAFSTFACGPATTQPTDSPTGSGGTVSGGGGTTGVGGTGLGSGGVVVGATGGTTGGGSGGTPQQGTGGMPTSSGGTTGSLDGYTVVPCTTTTSKSEVAAQMQTVGIVEFTTDLAGAAGGFIQFGKTTDYTLTAPIDWAAAAHRTLLLGMTSNTEWHYRIVVTSGQNACLGPDVTLQTGGLPNGGPPASIVPTKGASSAAPAEGFIVTSGGIGGLGSWAFIVNHEGEVVWAYEFDLGGGGGFGAEGVTRAHLSWDGKSMLARDLNVNGNAGAGNLYKVNLDGTSPTSVSLDTSHHDFTVTPTGIAYPAKTGSPEGCDAIHTANEDGTNDQVLIDLWPVLEPFVNNDSALSGKCHVNAIHYYADEDAFTVSDRERDMLVKISGDGDVLWTIGASPATITGADIQDWRVQHGHHLYDADHLLVFSNGPLTGGTSHALHFTISGTSATNDWSYSGMGNSGTLGDIQKLPNGNVLITASQLGQMHEIDENNMLVQAMKFQSLGYSHHRPTLYGAPPER
jgi:hypothetical protein